MPFFLQEDGTPVRHVNRWLRSLPTTGEPARKSWAAYASDLGAWIRFLRDRSPDVIDELSASCTGTCSGPRSVPSAASSSTQVRQRTRAATISIRGDADPTQLNREIVGLERLCVRYAEIVIDRVEKPGRQDTGKIRRLLPLP